MTGDRRDGGPTTDDSSREGVVSGDEPPDETDALAPSDAFGALGSETRTAAVQALADDAPLSFSDLFAATGEDTSAGFAYHLRQLTDRFVRQRDDERYELTDAGRSVVRDIRAGTYTESVDRGPVELTDDCPFCGRAELAATVADNVTEIDCERCGSPIVRLSVPPGGYVNRDAESLPEAVDAHHRRRIEAFGDGVCPECAGPVSARVERASREGVEQTTGDRHCSDGTGGHSRSDGTDDHPSGDENDDHAPAQVKFACDGCGADLRCPVALTVLDHPAVVAFYHDHDRDVRDSPVWNVGSEWRERVVSRDPWCVLVSARLDAEDLRLYVAGDGTVVDHRRVHVDEDHTSGSASERGRGDSGSASA